MLKAIKWTICYVVVWIVLSFFWAQMCFTTTQSEAGQAMGLVMGFFIITPGIFIMYAVIPVSIYLRKNKYKGWTFKNMAAGGYILLIVLSCFWFIFQQYQNYQSKKLWEQQLKGLGY